MEGELYDYLRDDGNRNFDLALRTEIEIKEWIHSEPFEANANSFLRQYYT